MPSGRPPKTTKDKQNRGTLRKSRVRKTPEKAVTGTVYLPQHLDSDERLAWQSLAPVLKQRGMMTADFAPAFEQLCGSWALCRKLAATIRAEGVSYRPPLLDKSGRAVFDEFGAAVFGIVRLHPCVGTLQGERKVLRNYLAAFGLTPADIGRVELPADDKPTGDEFGLDD